jgi:drug/metabolite transporter (DMT)-like permease
VLLGSGGIARSGYRCRSAAPVGALPVPARAARTVVRVSVLLALGSAIAYGLSDFLGGLFSRRSRVWPVAVVVQASGAAGILLAAPLFAGDPSRAHLLWGLLSGLGSGLGTAFLYRGLATGRMSVVAPLSAVGAAVLPVLVGVATGERPQPMAWVGIACALPAIWLVSAGEGEEGLTGDPVPRGSTGVVDGIVAGLGFGLLFVALGQVPAGAGMVPAGLGMAASVLVVVALAVLQREPWVPRDRHAVSAVLVGVIAALATVLFQLATQSGLLTVTSVLSSLYPAFTVLLAVLVLREHIHRGQAVGLALAGAAITLVSLG